MNKKWFLLLLAAMQAETVMQARGGGGGHSGGHGGGRGSRGRGGGSHSGHSSHEGHGGYGHGGHGYGRGGWGAGWGWAGGLWLGMALTMPLWWNYPSTKDQSDLKDSVIRLQNQVQNLSSEVANLKASNPSSPKIAEKKQEIEIRKQKVKDLIDSANALN